MSSYSVVFTQVDEFKGELTTSQGLEAMLDNLYDNLKDDEAVVLMIKNDCTLVCTRKKGHGDRVFKKFTNIGFSSSNGKVSANKAESLATAIRTIADDLPEFCYEAIMGDAESLKKTTKHLCKVYYKKAERMKAKGKPAEEIARVLARHDEIKRYLELSSDKLAKLIDTLVIEVPKCKKVFEELDELAEISAEEITASDE